MKTQQERLQAAREKYVQLLERARIKAAKECGAGKRIVAALKACEAVLADETASSTPDSGFLEGLADVIGDLRQRAIEHGKKNTSGEGE
ncbi:MAG TPA: hypothetical protein VF653_19535 [Methylomirabilota bacterium]